MATYPKPSETTPVFNPSYFTNFSNGLTIAEGDLRYAQLSGSIIRGLTTFNAGLSTANIYNSGNAFSVPSSSGQLALVSQIPSSSNFVDLSSSQTITGVKTFTAAPVISTITNTGTLTLPTTTGTLALTSQIPSLTNYMTLNTTQTVTAQKTFSLPLLLSSSSAATPAYSFSTDTSSGIYSVATGSVGISGATNRIATFSSSGLSLVDSLFFEDSGFTNSVNSDVLTASRTATLPDGSGYLLLDQQQQTTYNKTFQFSSPTTIASVTAASGTFTTSKNHGLLTGDSIKFPIIGSLTGIVAGTTYTISAVPSATQITLSGVTFGGTVGTAYYVIVSRSAANYSTAGGLVQFSDVNNLTNPLQIDTSACAVAPVLRFGSGASAVPIVFPTNGGSLVATTGTQTISGRITFSAGIAVTQAGSTTNTSGPFVVNPASTAMSAANNYFWSYFVAPTTTGSSTGTAATVVIAGPPTVAASNNYSFQISSGQTSVPAGTVSAPSIVFGSNNSSGLYSSSTNVLNAAISGVNIFQIQSTGVVCAGKTTTSTFQLGLNGSTYNQYQSGTATLTFTAVANFGFTSVGVTFPASFSSTPNIQVTNQSGNSFSGCTIAAGGASTSGFTIYSTNCSGATQTTSVTVAWFAYN